SSASTVSDHCPLILGLKAKTRGKSVSVKGYKGGAKGRLVDNCPVTSQEGKLDAAYNFYANLLGSSEQRVFSVDLAALNLQQHDLSCLEVTFTEQEVWATIKNMPLDKAPGPDGFTGRFYKCCWQVIKDDVMAVLSLYTMAMSSNSSFSTWHSSLCCLRNPMPPKLKTTGLSVFFAKLVTKILANRLAPRLPDLVSINQSAFVKGRTTSCWFSRWQDVYTEKRRWCNLLCLLLSTSHTRVLVNGEPGEPILHRRGLRQGDPLSPMLFLLAMEVLNALVSQATQENLFQPLAVQQAKFRISLYADDVIMFLRPAREDIALISQLLDFFGHVSGLRTNLAKSSVTPIHCSEEDLSLLSDLLVCEIKNFPCTYLGIPLTVHKPRKSDIFPLIDKVADSLPKLKASLLNRAGRLVVVRAVLSAIPIHLMIALDLPKWAIKAIDKRRRGFLWTGKEKANGGNCFVAWDKVQRPLQYGGLGITNLETMGWALRIRWLWLQKTDSSRPWEGLPIQVPLNAQALFAAAVETDIGNGEDTKFWTDRWLQGCTIAELAPNLIKAVPTRARKRLSISQALTNRRWIADIKGALSVQALVDYLKLWELVDGIVMQPEISDKHTWKLSRSGAYTSKSAYQAFFLGSVKFAPWKRIWKSCAPLRCKFFVWLAVKNKCWTADCLSKRGLPHPNTCPLCDQAEETINHLLVSCVFSREIWSTILRFIGLPTAAPQDERSFSGWWYRAISRVPKEMKKGLNSLIILVAWELWKHRNACVFEGVRPSVVLLCQEVERESSLWRLAGNTALHELLTRSSRQVCLPAGPDARDGPAAPPGTCGRCGTNRSCLLLDSTKCPWNWP
ncbi:LOW QUALITY PROTEIN: hypothetical protein U9M48_004616, partial [Paspalum notatum var. saurae]